MKHVGVMMLESTFEKELKEQAISSGLSIQSVEACRDSRRRGTLYDVHCTKIATGEVVIRRLSIHDSDVEQNNRERIVQFVLSEFLKMFEPAGIGI